MSDVTQNTPQPERKPVVELNNSIPQLAVKAFGASLYATCFALIPLFFMSFLIYEGTWGAIFYQIFALVLYTPILYMNVWRYGDRDRNYVKFGHMEQDLNRGLKLGLLAIVPYSLCLIAMLLSKAGIIPDVLWIVRLIYAPFVVVFNWLVPNMLETGVSATVENASYLGLFLASLLQLYVPVVTTIAYRLGYKGVSMYHRMVYNNEKKK